MKVQVFLLVASLFCAKVCAQKCYQCLSITTDVGEGINMPDTLDGLGFGPCEDPLPTVDCRESGGCMKAAYNFDFDIAEHGNVGVGVLIRTCGAPADMCMGDKELQEAFATQEEIIAPMLPEGSRFVSATGDACLCIGELCNSSTLAKVTRQTITSSASWMYTLSFLSFASER